MGIQPANTNAKMVTPSMMLATVRPSGKAKTGRRATDPSGAAGTESLEIVREEISLAMVVNLLRVGHFLQFALLELLKAFFVKNQADWFLAVGEVDFRFAFIGGRIRRDILGEYLRTGVQFAINVAVFKLLSMNTVYPVADIKKLSDKHGNVLPDVYLMESGSTTEDLARTIHTELAKGLLYAIDARDGLHLPRNYVLKDRDILSIVSAKKRK